MLVWASAVIWSSVSVHFVVNFLCRLLPLLLDPLLHLQPVVCRGHQGVDNIADALDDFASSDHVAGLRQFSPQPTHLHCIQQ